MESLNAMYSMQLQKVKDLADNINKYTENSNKMASEFSKLNNNLSSLNSIYGGMLSAMTISKKR